MSTTKRLVTIAFSLILLFMASAEGARIAEAKPIEITVDSPDFLELVGYVYLPDRALHPDPPLVILLHQMGRDHSIWGEFTQELVKDGWAVFAMDLRGHGYSIYEIKTRRNRSPGSFREGDFARFPADVRQMVDAVLLRFGNKIDTTRMAIIGASIGANTAVKFAVDEPRVQYLALLSPGFDYHGIRIANELPALAERHIYVAVADKDFYSNITCELIRDLAGDYVEVQFFSTMFHGNRLLNRTGELRSILRTHLRETFRQQ